RSVPVLRHLHRPGDGVQSGDRIELHCHASGRRDRHLVGTRCRSIYARFSSADSYGNDLLGGKSLSRRRVAGGVRGGRTARCRRHRPRLEARPQMNVNILAAERISKRFDGFAALTDVDFILRKGERVGLIGPNGSGKSTLVNCLTGILTPDDGSITFDGADITAIPAWVRAKRGLARTYQIPRPFR